MSKRKTRRNPNAMDWALQADKQWFADHPNERVRIRRIIPGEAGDLNPRNSHVRVEQMMPGAHHKKFLRPSDVSTP